MSTSPDVAAIPTGVRAVKSAARTLELLELLAARQNRPARLRELSDALGAPRSSVYALIKTLEEHGWVRSDSSSSMYSIGIRALLAGTTYLDTDPFLRIAQPHINELGVELDETIHFGRLERTDIVYLATKESSQYLRPFSRVGRRLPAYSTSMGKAILAERLDDKLDEHVPRRLTPITPNTITTHEDLLEDLKLTRARGYAFDNEENYSGVVCFGVALRYHRYPRDAISCSVPLRQLTDERRAVVIDGLERARIEIGRAHV